MAAPFPLKAVVFDLDGLMLNTEEIYDEVGATLLRRRGREFTPELKDRMMGRPGFEALAIMIEWHDLTDSTEALQAESEEVFNQLLPQRLAPTAGLLDLLSELDAARIPKAIATSSRRKFVDGSLSILKILSPFEFILSAEDVRRGKPDPEIYITAARRLNLMPEQTLVLEDSATGCRAAVAAGTFAVAVPGGHSKHHDFTGAKFIADTLVDRRIRDALGL